MDWYLTVFPSSYSERPMRTNFPSSLSSYRHSISLFWFCMTTSMSFHARRHAILSLFQYTFAPFDRPCLTFIPAFSSFPLFLPHIFQRLILPTP